MTTPDTLIKLTATSLPTIADEVFNHELGRRLEALATRTGKNYAVFTEGVSTPEEGITILPAPAVGPIGSTEICTGSLTVNGEKIKVTAFRNA